MLIKYVQARWSGTVVGYFKLNNLSELKDLENKYSSFSGTIEFSFIGNTFVEALFEDGDVSTSVDSFITDVNTRISNIQGNQVDFKALVEEAIKGTGFTIGSVFNEWLEVTREYSSTENVVVTVTPNSEDMFVKGNTLSSVTLGIYYYSLPLEDTLSFKVSGVPLKDLSSKLKHLDKIFHGFTEEMATFVGDYAE